MDKLKGTITTWYKDKLWGFATTSTGKIFFIHESSFRNHRTRGNPSGQLVRVGALVEFEVGVYSAERDFMDKLNSGKYRDNPAVAHRNPRHTINKKPRAANVVILEENVDGQI
jgi:hypothetical protein